jgi:alpha-L-fucosidase
MENEGIPVAQYELSAKHFTPKPNAAREWAKLARRAGQKYMVMTTKHHEGFCMWDTKLTNSTIPLWIGITPKVRAALPMTPRENGLCSIPTD